MLGGRERESERTREREREKKKDRQVVRVSFGGKTFPPGPAQQGQPVVSLTSVCFTYLIGSAHYRGCGDNKAATQAEVTEV